MNIFAFTALSNYFPEFISVNRKNDGIEIIVRSKPNPPMPGGLPMCGDTASITLTPEQARALKEAL